MSLTGAQQIGIYFRCERHRLGATHRTIATVAGVSVSTVRRIERGTQPSSPLDVARRLLACVDVSVLVDAEERPTATESDTARVAETRRYRGTPMRSPNASMQTYRRKRGRTRLKAMPIVVPQQSCHSCIESRVTRGGREASRDRRQQTFRQRRRAQHLPHIRPLSRQHPTPHQLVGCLMHGGVGGGEVTGDVADGRAGFVGAWRGRTRNSARGSESGRQRAAPDASTSTPLPSSLALIWSKSGTADASLCSGCERPPARMARRRPLTKAWCTASHEAATTNRRSSSGAAWGVSMITCSNSTGAGAGWTPKDAPSRVQRAATAVRVQAHRDAESRAGRRGRKRSPGRFAARQGAARWPGACCCGGRRRLVVARAPLPSEQ